MEIVLIYDQGERYDPDIVIKKFDTENSLVDFINDNGIGDNIEACYEINKEISIISYEKVTKYGIG